MFNFQTNHLHHISRLVKYPVKQLVSLYLSTASIVFLLTGCGLSAELRSNFYGLTLPQNAHLTLHIPLTIPSNEAGVHIQDGQITASALVKERHPNCRFEVREVKDHTQTVNPGTFKVSNVSLDTYLVSNQPIRLAALSGFSFYGGDGAMAEAYITDIYLRSDQQPNILRLSCEHWEDPNDGNHLRLNQIEQALGSVARFEYKS